MQEWAYAWTMKRIVQAAKMKMKMQPSPLAKHMSEILHLILQGILDVYILKYLHATKLQWSSSYLMRNSRRHCEINTQTLN